MIKPMQGLSQSEADTLLKLHGKNELVPSKLGMRFFELIKFLKDPMGLMLLVLAGIYFLVGQKQDAIVLMIAFIPVSAINIFLELKAEHALSALRSTFQFTAKVFRDGVLREISTLEIVPGDWIALEEGQTIPADGVLETATHLNVNESALTGESVPIEKSENTILYAGTTVLTGRGVVKVTQTGSSTRFGKVVNLLQKTEEGKSPLQTKVNKLVGRILIIVSALVVLLFILQYFRGKPFLESLLISLTFGMASVPEEFPLVFTLYLSLGAWRLSKHGVLVKALPSVETLGSVNVICTDKTGTLTEGVFKLRELISFHSMPETEQWTFAKLACEPIVVDSMERAIFEKATIELNLQDWTLIHDYPFELKGKHMSHAWKDRDGKTLVAMKGAIEGVLEHCAESTDFKTRILNRANELSSKGYRLLGLAGKYSSISGVREQDEQDLSFIGILAFSDPVRSSAKEAVRICQNENISIKMITGDHPLTAHAVADELNLIHSHDALYTGTDLENMNENELKTAFRTGTIFSRVTPEQKFALIHFLKNEGLIVAMTGDGVNDTPAMKIADIGISMGDNATDAARATAKMVLMKSDFNGIVHAITEGKRIFSNLKKSFSYLIAFHIPIVLLALIPPLFNLGELLLPIHIILLELLVHPVSAFTFENMKHLPSVKKDLKIPKNLTKILDARMTLTASLAGVLLSLVSLFLFLTPYFSFFSIEEKRSVAFVTVLFGNIGFVLLESWPQFTPRLVFTVTALLGVTVSITTFSTLSEYLHLSYVSPLRMLIACAIGLGASIPSWVIRNRQSLL